MVNARMRAWISAGLYTAIVVILSLLIFATPLGRILTNTEQLRELVARFGVWAPTVVIFFHALQVVAAPIPGAAIELADGYIFGWWGIAIAMAGLSVGSIIAIVLARKFGRPLVELLVTPKGMKQINPYARSRNQWLFFILFLLPGTPDDFLCFAIGLTGIPLTRAFAIALLGRLPVVAATVILGVTGSQLNFWEFMLIAIAVSLAAWLIISWTPLGKKMTLSPTKKRPG